MTNLLLQDPFAVLKEYPDKLAHILENPLRTECLQFSPRGDYLALGCANGGVVIYDVDTHRPVQFLGSKLGAHIRSVQSVSWSLCGRYILSAGQDWSVKLWDLGAPEQPLKQIALQSSVWNCQWIDSDVFTCIATAVEEDRAFIIDFRDIPKVRPLGVSDGSGSATSQGYVLTSVVHSKSREVVVTGTSKGWINFYRLCGSEEFELIKSLRIANSNIKHLIVSQNGEKLAINSSDRIIRQYSLNISEDTSAVEVELEHKYQDVINKLQWNSIFFGSKSADYLVASTHGSSAHELYLWETHSGTLVRVFEGAEEELMDIDWNFYNMSIVSNGLESGDVYAWSIVPAPKWSALAPDFEEVEENIDYQEKEDEFDQVHEQEQQQEIDLVEEVDIDLRARERYDVRGNDLLIPRFTIPTDYERILIMKQAMAQDVAEESA
ncbi:hypothetical protein HG536_0D04300 [Torulaspora globosa]|uniref:Uncharacterized protein n=1 Tax=Torulaspora globosa TaxID=48254 RepID=A0A7G3ZHC2_9SACH|nr:uncharacterized protein HG536_0D04300 [Torulaspora globosa]QLL32908.1 hypothetical protein HG536_0D04300 [Torulaspora globosa]